MLILSKLDDIADDATTCSMKVAAARRAILAEKLEHRIRVADITHNALSLEPERVVHSLDLRGGYIGLDTIQAAAQIDSLR